MPIVPRAESQQGLVDLPEVRQANIPADASGEAFGRLSERAISSASRLQEFVENERLELDKVRVNDADTELFRTRSEIENEFNEFTGEQAPAVIDHAQQRWTEKIQNVTEGLANDRQKEAVKRRAEYHFNLLRDKALRHSSRETERHRENVFTSRVDLLSDMAISGDEETMNEAVDTLMLDAKDFYSKEGATVIADKQKEILDKIKNGREQLKLEAEVVNKRRLEELKVKAYQDVGELFFADVLTKNELDARKELLGKDYVGWLGKLEARNKAKEKEAKGEKVVDDPKVNADLSSEAMTMPLDATTDDINKFREKVAQAVTDGKLTPGAGRSIISDAERALQLDPARKSGEDEVVKFFRLDYNNGLYGEVGTTEARAEYARQVKAFKAWTRGNLDKEPVEYYEKVSDIPKKGFIAKLLGIGGPEITPQQRREEITGVDKDREATEILRNAGKPITRANLEYVKERL